VARNEIGRRSKLGLRRLCGSGVLVGLAALASGCLPPLEVGVTTRSGVAPVVVSCGAYISSIEASDSDTGQLVWSAEAVVSESGAVAGKGSVRVGELPDAGWVERVSLQEKELPSTWRIVVGTHPDFETIVAPADGNGATVYRPAGSESASKFDEQTCGGLPFSLRTSRIIAGGIVLLGVLLLGLLILRSRRRSAADRAG
jgi:hypothetical protein